jgi:adenylate kinase
MNILIAGVQNSEEESIVKLALERLEGKAKFKTLSFSEFSGAESAGEELGLIKATQRKVREILQIKAVADDDANVIINGYCTVNARLGYFPILTKDTMQAFRPDMMVHIRVDPLALEGKIRDPEAMNSHQDFEKSYSMYLCATTGCGMKSISSGIDGARKASDELYAVLKELLVMK